MKKLLAIFLLAGSAHAETMSSVYSDFDIDKCKKTTVSEPDEGGQWNCKGIKGFDVFYAEGDLRGTLSFGPNANYQCSQSQSFGHFNSPGKKIEWRLKNGKPIATIVRWFTDNGEPGGKQNWLVVTKLNGKDACRTAIVDTKLSKANLVAQQKADKSANFNCEKDTVEVIGVTTVNGGDIMTSSPCAPAN